MKNVRKTARGIRGLSITCSGNVVKIAREPKFSPGRRRYAPPSPPPLGVEAPAELPGGSMRLDPQCTVGDKTAFAGTDPCTAAAGEVSGIGSISTDHALASWHVRLQGRDLSEGWVGCGECPRCASSPTASGGQKTPPRRPFYRSGLGLRAGRKVVEEDRTGPSRGLARAGSPGSMACRCWTRKGCIKRADEAAVRPRLAYGLGGYGTWDTWQRPCPASGLS